MTATGVIRSEFRFVLNGSQAEFHVDTHTDGTIDTETLMALADILISWATGSVLPHLSTGIQLVELFVQSLDSAQPGEVSYTVGLPSAGGNATEPLPNQTALLTTLRTAQNDKSGRGRIFMPGIYQDAMLGGLFQAALTTFFDNAWSALVTDLVDSAYQWVVYSKKEDLANPVTSWAVRGIPAGLNRRRIGRGF